MGEHEGEQITEAEVFVYSDPCVVDVLSLCGAQMSDRAQWHVWESMASDVQD